MPVQSTRNPTGNSRAFVSVWEGLTLADGTGVSVGFSQYADKSVQVVGTFGAGGTLVIEGSNDGTNWSVLTDPQGNPLILTATKIELVAEATAYVRPRVTGGDGATNVSVYLLVKE